MQRPVFCAALCLAFILGSGAPSDAARRRVADRRMPVACQAPIPQGRPDPYIPAATMVRRDKAINLYSCVILGPAVLPAASMVSTSSSFMLFTEDGSRRAVRMLANDGQPGGAATTHAGLRVVPISLTFTFPSAEVAQSVTDNVLVEVQYWADDGGARTTTSRMILAAQGR